MAKTLNSYSPWDMPVSVCAVYPPWCLIGACLLTGDVTVTIPKACFLSALQMVAGQTGKVDMARNAVIHAEVHIGQPEDKEGFGLQVDIQVEGVEDEELIQAAHKVSLTAEGRPCAASPRKPVERGLEAYSCHPRLVPTAVP